VDHHIISSLVSKPRKLLFHCLPPVNQSQPSTSNAVCTGAKIRVE
jgi:hypothetical protein